jgi:diadenylate cyclase
MTAFFTNTDGLEVLKMCFEIALLAYIIYKILYFVRGARGSSILAGLVGLAIVLSLLAKYFKLYIISWLLDSFWAIIGLAVVVIFQPELRRAFAQLGSFSIWQGRKRREVVSEIVQAVQDMARRKCGALIVLEKRIGLQNFIDDAIKLDVKLHAMMLESIFFPNSPLHDGAVIIRDDRIVAARVILPLTRAENISRRLGTRHRAALGISEDTDAVTIIVSEETGAVSVAYRSALHRDLSAAELTGYLEKLVMSHQDDDDLAETVRLFEEQPTLGPVQTPVVQPEKEVGK